VIGAAGLRGEYTETTTPEAVTAEVGYPVSGAVASSCASSGMAGHGGR
jgi:hypothetical protein